MEFLIESFLAIDGITWLKYMEKKAAEKKAKLENEPTDQN